MTTLVRFGSHGRRGSGGARRRHRLVWSQLQSQGATTQLSDEGSDADGGGGGGDGDLVEQIVRRQVREVMTIHLLARALGLDIETLLALLQEEALGGVSDGDDGRGGVWFGAVPASAAAVSGLEKQTFHAAEACGGGGVAECAICLEGFEDGEEVSVMPCSHGHGFHPNCIAKWLGCSNMCPLCRHELPTAVDGQ